MICLLKQSQIVDLQNNSEQKRKYFFALGFLNFTPESGFCQLPFSKTEADMGLWRYMKFIKTKDSANVYSKCGVPLFVKI